MTLRKIFNPASPNLYLKAVLVCEFLDQPSGDRALCYHTEMSGIGAVLRIIAFHPPAIVFPPYYSFYICQEFSLRVTENDDCSRFYSLIRGKSEPRFAIVQRWLHGKPNNANPQEWTPSHFPMVVLPAVR